MKKFIALALGALLHVSVPAFAQDDCFAPEQVLEKIGSTFSPVKAKIVLNAEQTARVVAWINEKNEDTDLKFTVMIVVAHENGRIGILAGNDGQVCGAQLMPAELVPELFAAITGKGA